MKDLKTLFNFTELPSCPEFFVEIQHSWKKLSELPWSIFICKRYFTSYGTFVSTPRSFGKLVRHRKNRGSSVHFQEVYMNFPGQVQGTSKRCSFVWDHLNLSSLWKYWNLRRRSGNSAEFKKTSLIYTDCR